MSDSLEGAVILLALTGGIAGAFLITRWFNWIAFGQKQAENRQQKMSDEHKEEQKK